MALNKKHILVFTEKGFEISIRLNIIYNYKLADTRGAT